MELSYAVVFLSIDFALAYGPVGRFGQRGVATSSKGLRNTRYTSRNGLDTHGFPTFPVSPGRGRGNPPSRGNDRSGERRGSLFPFTVPYSRTTAFRKRGTAGKKNLSPQPSSTRPQGNKLPTYLPNTKRKIAPTFGSRTLRPQSKTGTRVERTPTTVATTTIATTTVSPTVYKSRKIFTTQTFKNQRSVFDSKGRLSRTTKSSSSTKFSTTVPYSLMPNDRTNSKSPITAPYVSTRPNCTVPHVNGLCQNFSKCSKTSICGMSYAFKNVAKTNILVIFITILVCVGILSLIVVRRVRESRRVQIFSITRVI